MRKISKLAKFTYVRQSMPFGDGHAINCARHLISDNEPVLVVFGDTLYSSQITPAEQVVNAYRKYNTSIIGLSDVP